MSNISIVTAFYDIGRGNWTPDKGLPSYLHRPVSVYLERFKYLCELENELIVYTHPDMYDTIADICSGRENTRIVCFDPFTHFAELLEKIDTIQRDKNFYSTIKPAQQLNPEYWNEDYVLVTNLKSYFVDHAIKSEFTTNDMVAWIDFGYCRSEANIPASKKWIYKFDEEKIHLFNYKPYDDKPIKNIIRSNDVYILGAKVVAHKSKWPLMNSLMFKSINDLMAENFVDDDQGHWLNSYIMSPESFELHKIPDHQFGHNAFVLFNEFNEI